LLINKEPREYYIINKGDAKLQIIMSSKNYEDLRSSAFGCRTENIYCQDNLWPGCLIFYPQTNSKIWSILFFRWS
jgi:hypothetical protein